MKLLTKELLTKFEKQPQEDVSDNTKVIAHYFNPTGSGDWYAITYDTENKTFWGLADLGFAEFGTFSLTELEQIKCPPFGLGIERDLHFQTTTLKDLKKLLNM